MFPKNDCFWLVSTTMKYIYIHVTAPTYISLFHGLLFFFLLFFWKTHILHCFHGLLFFFSNFFLENTYITLFSWTPCFFFLLFFFGKHSVRQSIVDYILLSNIETLRIQCAPPQRGMKHVGWGWGSERAVAVLPRSWMESVDYGRDALEEVCVYSLYISQ